MESEKDIRWIQRYDNFQRACARMTEVTMSDQSIESLSDLEREGLVQRFEYTFELAWKVLQDLMTAKGYDFVKGPNGTLQQALEDGIIKDHDGWRAMAKARTLTTHTYDEDDILSIVDDICEKYSPLLADLDNKLRELAITEQQQ
ncbi:MAG: nucleotidyltransferase substrate binding protein [Bacteroidaceae bacterium]|nr:nucleotidyltransferase substrate binding protein [Bacteroidaceae bacterium]